MFRGIEDALIDAMKYEGFWMVAKPPANDDFVSIYASPNIASAWVGSILPDHEIWVIAHTEQGQSSDGSGNTKWYQVIFWPDNDDAMKTGWIFSAYLINPPPGFWESQSSTVQDDTSDEVSTGQASGSSGNGSGGSGSSKDSDVPAVTEESWTPLRKVGIGLMVAGLLVGGWGVWAHFNEEE